VGRKYVRHLLRAGSPVDRELIVFTKTGPQATQEEVEHYASGLTQPEFRAPTYYGRAATVEGDTGILGIHLGRQPQLALCSRKQLLRITRAVGAINALTTDAIRRLPNLPIGTMRAGPVADQLRAALISEGEMMQREPSLRDALDRFAALENGAMARLAAIGNRFFSHQDIARETS